ncbi:phosphonate C-P lyase system protein PhnG [Tistrella mobilis]|uniref:PhnG protein n=1 Tax=Tistrella mobilis (strain KA081020-065) TaxID=1110502 RepID=I3TMF2_TISMK|nr:PhnG protein [Tistrella mobilis KA081020-065]MAM73897.1 phosphonate C-P lyase system protein PhnG [Tistrella sp.]
MTMTAEMAGGTAETAGGTADQAARRRWLAVLARADRGRLQAALDDLPGGRAGVLAGAVALRRPETGLAMVRGRAGGAGARFNLGEMTVSRAVVRLKDGEAGVGYVAGRDRAKAELVAVLDALLQTGSHGPRLMRDLVEPLAAEQAAARALASRKAAASRVEFFTMVRGE